MVAKLSFVNIFSNSALNESKTAAGRLYGGELSLNIEFFFILNFYNSR